MHSDYMMEDIPGDIEIDLIKEWLNLGLDYPEGQ